MQVHVGERVQLDAPRWRPPPCPESVLVVGESPQLEAGSATIGQVIDCKLISEIPLGDGTAYGLTRLIPGASFERSYALQRPMDNDNLRGMTITGTINSEFTIDGSSNIVSQARAGIQPPVGRDRGVQGRDRRLRRADRPHRRGCGEPGAEDRHEPVPWLRPHANRDDSRSANLFASDPERLREDTAQTTTGSADAIGGPIFRNKTFSCSREKLQDDTIEAFTSSVPTARMRNGDFSELLSQRRPDLRSAHRAPGQRRRRPRSVSRQYHPGRQNQSRRAQRARGTFRPPNQAGAADFSQNFFAEQPWTYALQLPDGAHRPRVDDRPAHLSAASSGTSDGKSATTSPARLNGVEITRGATDRFNFNYAVGHTAVLSPTTVLDLKGSWLRFNDDLFPLYTIDPASLGFSVDHVRRCSATTSNCRASALESGSPTTAGTRRDARRTAERLQQRTQPAVLQRAVRSDADQDVRLAYLRGWI